MNNVLDILHTGHKGEDTELNIPEGFVLTKQKALELRDFKGKFCITSLYLLEEINKLRIREDKNEMRHDNLLSTIKKEFENGKISELKFQVRYLTENKKDPNPEKKMYLLPERELEYILGYLSGTFRKEMVDSFRFLRTHFQELLMQEKEKLLEDKDKEMNKLKEKVKNLEVEVKEKKQRFRDYGIEDYATVSRFLEEIEEFNYKNRDKLFALLTKLGVIKYEKVCHLKSSINDFNIGQEVKIKSNKTKRKIRVYDKEILSKIWKENKHKDLSLKSYLDIEFADVVNLKTIEEEE